MPFNGLPPHLAQVFEGRGLGGGELEKIHRLALVSDFACEVLAQQPDLIGQLDDALSPLDLAVGLEPDWPRQIRRWRRAQSVKLIWRDVSGRDSVEQTLQGSTWIAEQALSQTFNALLQGMQQVHGVVRAEDGQEQHMVVLGLGKLGGGELNFSSDVDLVYAFSGHGNSDGARPLPAETYFTRLGQRLANLLDEVTADGFSHRVDLRLRPFGASGRLLLSFNGMEQYFQTSGRDWERYAWLKARPVAGDIASGYQLLELLRPFVYRRYLDFTAIDGLREMKGKIEAEVQRREIADDLKLGRGGIREIEFFVQAMQIIYGGRVKSLQLKGLLPGLDQLLHEGLISADMHDALSAAYLFLRRLENRVQMLRDAQMHHLPEPGPLLARIAAGLDYADGFEMLQALERHRSAVQRLFSGLLSGAADQNAEVAGNVESADVSAQGLHALGFTRSAYHAERLQSLCGSSAVAALGDRSQQRLQRVIQAFIPACQAARHPDQCLDHAISFLQAIVRRGSYIALLDEQSSALQRVVQVFDESLWLTRSLIGHPLLLDELLDARVIGQRMDSLDLPGQIDGLMQHHGEDTETALLALNEFKISYTFKIAYQFLFQGLPAVQASRLLTLLAELILQHCNDLAGRELQLQHGAVASSSFAVIGYGSLGARTLAFNSDLDLVFLNQAPAQSASDGRRPIDASRFFLRQAQKLISLLGLSTPSGSLYEVDIRLRPDGAKGLLVSSMESFEQYQKQRAWTWELQALVRARAVAGDPSLCLHFERVREALITAERASGPLLDEISAMRRRMRAELDRSDDGHYDLKHGRGGLTDIEFFLQAQILLHACRVPELSRARETLDVIACLRHAGIVDAWQAGVLVQAYERLLSAGLRCHLDNSRRVLPRCGELSAMADAVSTILGEFLPAFE
ncbi:MAG: bifunctional [glutamate--ammonia ligase]-adenylyl-L-tyrosine phosphorylase/[glutamate--ammonia-ligase] adenylyltransferase [Arenimonas sp.]|nr:bifunctional [glutamate--ammonia ligase]-adenylyl-L-tyrosine phosphorylase/[glutamate--ammonia-ligase] adenylyltransferase [Arenimonas sp.]MBP7981363.1 bifunctional [glutamate--ammonia ligase]-adenylyl-L-tyrosine phosphorylase/[glutamate--ammonia-ligase] adenylyltransferase [Arenimonas sp.]